MKKVHLNLYLNRVPERARVAVGPDLSHISSRRVCALITALSERKPRPSRASFCPYRLWRSPLCLWFVVAVVRMWVVRGWSYENSETVEGSRSLVVIDGDYLRPRG